MKFLKFRKNHNGDYEQIIWKYISKNKNNGEKIIAENLLNEIKSLETDNNISVILTSLFYELEQEISYNHMIRQDFEKGLLMLIKLNMSTNLEQKEIISLKIRKLEEKIQCLHIKRNILKRMIKN